MSANDRMDDDKARPGVVRLVPRPVASPGEERPSADPSDPTRSTPGAGAARPGWNVRPARSPRQRSDAAVAESTERPDAGSRPVASAPPSAADGPEHDEWLRTWQRQEITWLSGRVQELERQLRRRTVGLGGALLVSWLIGAVGVAALWPGGAEPPSTIGAIPPPGEPSASQPAAALSEPTPSIDAPANGPVPTPPASLEPEIGSPAIEPSAPPPAAIPDDPLASTPQIPDPGAPETDDRLEADPDRILEAMLAEVQSARQNRAAEPSARPSTAPSAERADLGPTGYTANTVVFLRAEPEDDGGVVNVLAPGDTVERLDVAGDWLQVEYVDLNGQTFTGYVPARYLDQFEDEPPAD